MSDHRPLYYVTDAEAELVREIVAGLDDQGRRDAFATDWPRIWTPPDGPIELVEATGRADCRACGHRIEKDVPAIRFGFLSNPPGGTVTAAYIHARCPEEGPCP